MQGISIIAMAPCRCSAQAARPSQGFKFTCKKTPRGLFSVFFHLVDWLIIAAFMCLAPGWRKNWVWTPHQPILVKKDGHRTLFLG